MDWRIGPCKPWPKLEVLEVRLLVLLTLLLDVEDCGGISNRSEAAEEDDCFEI